MAYVSQEMKAKLAPTIKAICKKYNIKASIAVRNHMTLVLNIKSGKIDFIGNSNKVCGNDFYQVSRGFTPNTTGYDQVNPYHFQSHYDGAAKQFLTEMIAAMEGPDFFNEDDAQTDYFHRSHYIDINIGSWNKPYALEK
jgi:hypothetical protein